MFLPGFRVLKRLPWALLFVVSGAALTQLQPWFLQSWEKQFNVHGRGGDLGYYAGLALEKAFGDVGSIVALVCVYVISLIWLPGIRPVAIVKQIFLGTRALARKAATEREQKRLAAADERDDVVSFGDRERGERRRRVTHERDADYERGKKL